MSGVISKENTPDYGRVIEKMNALMQATEQCLRETCDRLAALEAEVARLHKNNAFCFQTWREVRCRQMALEVVLVTGDKLDIDELGRMAVRVEADLDRDIAERGLITFDDDDDDDEPPADKPDAPE